MTYRDLSHYLAENETVYEFRVKFAMEPSDKQLDAMELHLRKYDAYDIGTPTKAIIQKNPRDFRDVGAVEVYTVDFKTRLPAAPNQLLAEISQKTGIHERLIVVRNKLEPLHMEETDAETATEKYKPRLTDEKYSDAEKVKADDFYGEKFKAGFIKDLTKNRATHYTKVKK
jgi:hypothetical protein